MFPWIYKVLLFVFLAETCLVQGRGGGRGGGSRGGSRGSSSHSYSHSSPSYSSHPSPSYSHPSPSYSHPSPSYSHPSPSYSHPSPSYSHPSPSYSHPAASHPASLSYPAYHPLPSAPVYRPVGWNSQTNTNTRPIGFHTDGHAPVGPPKQVSTVGSGSSSHNGPEITRPIGFVPPGSPGHSTGTANQPVGPPKTIAGVGNTNTGGRYERPPAYNPAGYGSPSAGYNFPPPAYSPAGHPAYSPGTYHAPPAYSPGNYHAPPAYSPQHTPGATIINNNHYYHPPPYVPTYHYTTTDTGSNSLGFFLGYSLGRLNTPSFHYHGYSSYYDPVPRYDHYTVHHYYHNSNTVPKEATIQPNAVVTCVGDSGSFCPANTTSLCTNNGAVMCVASATSTVPCSDVRNTNCVKSSVPCVNNTAPECAGATKKSTDVAIPCISTAKIFADVSFVNNSVVIVDSTDNGTVTGGNSSVTGGNSSVTGGNSTVTGGNSTVTGGNSTTTASPVTTTSQPRTPQTFCVTILALPAERKVPENEKFIDSADSLFGKFASKVLGLS